MRAATPGAMLLAVRRMTRRALRTGALLACVTVVGAGCATTGVVDDAVGAFERLEPVLLDVGPVTVTLELADTAYVALFEVEPRGGVALLHPSRPDVEMGRRGDFISLVPAPRLSPGRHVLSAAAGWRAPAPGNLRRYQVLGPVRPAVFVVASREPIRLERLRRVQEAPRDYLVGESGAIMEAVSRLVVPRAADTMDRSWAASMRYVDPRR